MIRSDRVCVHCLKPIPASARLDSFFCLAAKPTGDRRHARSDCHKAWANHRRSIQNQNSWSKEMEQALAQAHRRAFMYRLAIQVGSVTWIYPDPGRPSPRFDGVARQTPGFRIKPFELPVVPIAGIYGVGFCDADGNMIDTQFVVERGSDLDLDLSSFDVEPIIAVSVEIGERLQPHIRKPTQTLR